MANVEMEAVEADAGFVADGILGDQTNANAVDIQDQPVHEIPENVEALDLNQPPPNVDLNPVINNHVEHDPRGFGE